ncbi:Hsp70 family protein [Reyranella sp. CPCC 100927]|uniref:Hsp70 family protein n=1 Tax=Reyranella sp. CPCC 100927 TaxID=2599616 RepID=UPI0011B6BC29|nr:Hsp70 family protein [Reyranella sp. CPCC 100927]TWT02107.1 Hsp70 family protein [Reyranella sp. CPCC 100927]
MEPIWIAVAAGGAVLLVVLLLMLGRRKERVIDMSAPVTAADEKPVATVAADTANETTSAGEILEFRGQPDALCGLADWLMEDAARTLSVDLSVDRAAMTRLADAAEKASADLLSSGHAVVELPYLVADASGPKHYRREMTREEAELGMVQHGPLQANELLAWRGRDERTVELGLWIDAEASDQFLAPASVVRLANATEQAMADIERSGRAVVDLQGLTTDKGVAFNFRHEFDRAALDDMIGTG